VKPLTSIKIGSVSVSEGEASGESAQERSAGQTPSPLVSLPLSVEAEKNEMHDHGAGLAADVNDTGSSPTEAATETSVIGPKCPNDGRYWENQCARCGSSIMFHDCDNCAGEGFIEDDDWQADEGDGHTCDWCNGAGGHWACVSDEAWCEGNPRTDRAEVERSTLEWFTFEPLPLAAPSLTTEVSSTTAASPALKASSQTDSDSLAVLRQVSPLEEQKEDQDVSAGLIHQPIPDVEGTEPRPNCGVTDESAAEIMDAFAALRFATTHQQENESITRVIAAIRADEQLRTRWQPIESAPKDGTAVLVYRPRSREPIAIRSVRDWCGPNCCPSAAPKFWMPLPAAPSEAK
jgi:hypothetical protein